MHNSVHGRICQIDAAISDAPKPIGWELCVRASYYLDVGTCPAHPVPPYSTTGTPWSCINVSPTPRAREKSESPPHTNTEKLEQKSEFQAHLEESGQKSELPVYCLVRAGAGITLIELSSKSPHVLSLKVDNFLSSSSPCHQWSVLSNVKV